MFRLELGDAHDKLNALPEATVSAVITDPPYGYGLTEWDAPPDTAYLWRQFARVVSPEGFVAVFGQLPSALPWLVQAELHGFTLLEHVVWVKRIANPMHRLSRAHESVFVFGRAKRAFYETSGPFEDVKLPGVLVDTYTLEGIDRYIKDLQTKLSGKDTRRVRQNAPGGHGSNGSKFGAGSIQDRSPTKANFTNVWSFLSPSQTKVSLADRLHPTQKPLPVLLRLVEMLTPEGGLVVDPFAGSGTTAHACLLAHRHFSGCEISPEYHALATKRLQDIQNQPSLDFSRPEAPDHA